MNCHECRQWIDDLLLRDPDEAPPAEVAGHLADCDECAREHTLALETLEAITPGVRAVASPRLKQRLMPAIPAATLDEVTTITQGVPHRLATRSRPRTVRSVLAFALAASVVLAMILFPIGGGFTPRSKDGAFSLLAQASPAEARSFAADDVVGRVSEIVVEPVADAALAPARWLPLISIGADGKIHYDQLKLGDDRKEGYTIRDESWYDPVTHRFAHVLTLEGRPLFANSYDGRSVHRLEVDEQGRARIRDESVAPGFQPPQEPAAFLGILAVAMSASDKDKISRPDLVRDEGPVKLADGAPAHVLRVVSSESDSGIGLDTYDRVIIRDDDHTVDSVEFIVSGKKIYTIRRGPAASRREPPYGWDLAGLRPAVEKDRGVPKSPVQALADMIRFDVSVDDMARRADYPVYVFGKDPTWSTRRQIVDMLDLPSPPHRMFAAVYPAKDRRHVVFMQAHTFNANMGPVARESKLVYTSPAGIKVWSSKNDKSMAKILLSSIGSTRLIFSDTPANDCTSYLLETPDGAFPIIAVNGVLTDAELHGLVDSLVRVRPK